MAIATKQKRVKIHISYWVASVYITLSLILIPWTLYLAVSLPARHLSRHWDVGWVGLDIAIIASLLITGLLAKLKSRWLVITSSIAGSLLLVDAWFDIVSERPGTQLNQAIILALLFELPMTLISFGIAMRVLIRNID